MNAQLVPERRESRDQIRQHSKQGGSQRWSINVSVVSGNNGELNRGFCDKIIAAWRIEFRQLGCTRQVRGVVAQRADPSVFSDYDLVDATSSR